MDRGFSVDVDYAAVIAALDAYGDRAQSYINDASRESAQSMEREAESRLQRQLGPNATGETLAGIESMPARDGNGYVVVSGNDRMPMLPDWIDDGTKKGKPGSHTEPARPFFQVSAELEKGSHRRRISDGLQECAEDMGLGDH